MLIKENKAMCKHQMACETKKTAIKINVLFAQCGQCGAVLKALSQNVFRECNEV
jgi:hypothetical protein